MKKAIFWFRRDLRLYDNTGLCHVLKTHDQVACIFIFDENILSQLDASDRKISFLFDVIQNL